jgi:hypothetical protein
MPHSPSRADLRPARGHTRAYSPMPQRSLRGLVRLRLELSAFRPGRLGKVHGRQALKPPDPAPRTAVRQCQQRDAIAGEMVKVEAKAVEIAVSAVLQPPPALEEQASLGI